MKKTWSAPKLVVHGNVETITQQTWKNFGGPSDGFVFQNTTNLSNPS